MSITFSTGPIPDGWKLPTPRHFPERSTIGRSGTSLLSWGTISHSHLLLQVRIRASRCRQAEYLKASARKLSFMPLALLLGHRILSLCRYRHLATCSSIVKVTTGLQHLRRFPFFSRICCPEGGALYGLTARSRFPEVAGHPNTRDFWMSGFICSPRSAPRRLKCYI